MNNVLADYSNKQLPVFYVDGKELTQSMAIAQYLGDEHGMLQRKEFICSSMAFLKFIFHLMQIPHCNVFMEA